MKRNLIFVASLFFFHILLSFFYSIPAKAKGVQVAFIEIYGPNGELLRYSEGGRFSHSAISYQGQWLHAYPHVGVQLVSTKELEKIGKIAEIVNLPDVEAIQERLVRNYLGKPFDFGFAWDDQEIYCAELIAKLLGIGPEPMFFDARYWPKQYQRLNGLPGISPDRLYVLLNSRTWFQTTR